MFRPSFRLFAAIAVLSASALLAACGGASSSSSHSNAQASAPTQSAQPAANTSSIGSAGSGTTVRTAHGSVGTYLVGPSGRALYLWDADHNGMSACSGACASAWPPLTTSGKPRAAGGAQSADLGTVARADGRTQVTYKGHPLYYFIEDTAPGQMFGQGSDNFGAQWWLVAPSGSVITASSSGAGSSSSTTSSGPAGY